MELIIFGELKKHKKSGPLHEKMLLINKKAIPEVPCMGLKVRFALYLPGGGALPYMGYLGTCRGIGYGFWRFSILK